MFLHSSMRLLFLLGPFLLLVTSLPTAFGQIGSRETLVGPERTVFQNTDLQKWEFGLHLGLDSREYRVQGADTIDVDWQRIEARLGVDITPFLQARVDLGAARGDVGGASSASDFGVTAIGQGETGLRAGGLLRLALLEHILEPSPVAGAGSAVRVGVEGGLRTTESNLREDFNVQDTFVTTDLWYHRGWVDIEDRLTERRSVGSAWRLGLTWLDSSGEFAGRDIDANRNFALELGAAFGFRNNWVARVDVRTFGSERELTVGGNFRF